MIGCHDGELCIRGLAREPVVIDGVNEDILAHLSPRNLLIAYSQGMFPMVEGGRLLWFSPNPRGLLPLDSRFHIARSLARCIRRGRFTCTIDRAFDCVVSLCANRGDGSPTWISPEMQAAYARMHALGFAHSVEAWRGDGVCEDADPVGGLYGVAIGGAFFAESMFHRATDAGKVALAHLVGRLRSCGYVLCDVQWATDNLRRFGAYDVSRSVYLAKLAAAIEISCRFA